MKSEMKMPRDRDREVKCPKISREFSRNETLAGYCRILQKFMMIMAMMITQGKFLSIGKFCWIERYTFVQMEKIWIELQKNVTQGKTIWKLFEIHHRPN